MFFFLGYFRSGASDKRHWGEPVQATLARHFEVQAQIEAFNDFAFGDV